MDYDIEYVEYPVTLASPGSAKYCLWDKISCLRMFKYTVFTGQRGRFRKCSEIQQHNCKLSLFREKFHKMPFANPDKGSENVLFSSSVQCTFVQLGQKCI